MYYHKWALQKTLIATDCYLVNHKDIDGIQHSQSNNESNFARGILNWGDGSEDIAY